MTAPSTRSAARARPTTRSGSSTASRSASVTTSRKGSWPAGGGLETVDVAEAGERGLIVHDAHVEDPSHATALARLAEAPTGPTPIGVFRDVVRPVYGEELALELEQTRAGVGIDELEKLLRSGDTWTVA